MKLSYIRYLIPLFILLIIMMACTQKNDAIRSVDAETFRSEITAPSHADAQSLQLLDVRTPEEYNAGHIEGAKLLDVNAPDFLQRAKAELQADSPIYLYCRSGARSMKAAQMLAAEGFTVVNLKGGYLAYTEL